MIKKYLPCILAILVAGTAQAEGINYGTYSEEYYDCLRNSTDGETNKNCYTEEYYRIRRQIDDLKQKIKATPEFAEYNNTELSLPENIDNMQKYNDLHCKYMNAASENHMFIDECKMNMANFLHVDLHKIYEAIKSKREKSLR